MKTPVHNPPSVHNGNTTAARSASLVLLAAAACSVGPILSAQAERPAPPPRTDAGSMHANAAEVSRRDRSFLSKAHESGLKEIAMARMALRSTDPEVKALAQTLLADHEKSSGELTALARARGLALEPPRDLEMDELADKNGRDLDEAFAEMAGEAHEDAVDLFEEAAEESDDPEIRAFAARHVLTLRQHLQQAERLDERLD